MVGIFDSHAHYDDGAFDADREALLPRMHSEGVAQIMTCGCDLPSSQAAMDLAEQYDFIWFSAGFHPENEADATLADFKQLRTLLHHRKCRAVGEIGLDYYWTDACPKALQLERFEQQILIANEMDLPVIVHDREAHQDTFDLLQKHRPRGVVHCFSGSVEMMRELVKLGFYIGFNGVVTFKNARKPLEVAAQVPEERLLLETDAPYLAPVPLRGKRCDSTMIQYTAQRIAELRGVSVQTLINQANQNACRLFQIT